MIALDTNVLIRYAVWDDPEQAEAAAVLLESLTPVNPGFICREVLVETAWVLERSYRLSRHQVANILENLILAASLVIEASDDVMRVLPGYRRGEIDFADMMILAAARRTGAGALYTFDRKLASFEEATLLPPAP